MSCCPRCELEAELARVAHSPLMAKGGFGVYRGLLDAPTIGGLLDEALRGRQRADRCSDGVDREEVRGGEPARAVTSIEGGPRQAALFTSAALGRFVSQQVGAPVRACGQRASFSLYAGAGAFLDLHRDVKGCDLALITCLHDNDADADGGAIDLWLDDLATPLGELRAAPDRARYRTVLSPGDSLLLHGGVVPHRIPPVRGERVRVVSLMCFELQR